MADDMANPPKREAVKRFKRAGEEFKEDAKEKMPNQELPQEDRLRRRTFQEPGDDVADLPERMTSNKERASVEAETRD